MSAASAHRPRAISTVTLSGTLPEKLEAAAAAGFDGVEIFENDLLTFDGSPADVRRIAEGLGLSIVLFEPFRDFEAMPEPQRVRNLDRAERKFDMMEALGTDLILVCSNTNAAVMDDDARAAADLVEMAVRAWKRGLRVGFEALAWGRHVNRWRHAWKIVQQAGHPALGLIVDSFHTLAVGDDASGIAGVPADRLFFVQIADAPQLSMDVLSWSRHFRNFPGQGDLDVTGFVRAVAASGYRGPLSLEIFNDDFRAAPARMTARDGLRSLLLLEAEAGLAELPPPPRLDGFGFLEFAVDDEAAGELAGFLAGLGFHHAGRHRSKAVDLYRQGRINLVLNREPDSAASEHFQLHGASVCAMALRVDSVERALHRACVLLCQESTEHAGEGEQHLPGVRAPDGALVLLVEAGEDEGASWRADFHMLPAPPEGAGLMMIDHVAQALPAGQMDSFVLFWRAVFGLQPQPLWELADPYGVIRSRAMVSPEGSVRLPLNISQSRETATGRFVSAYAGAGVRCVAFATGDAAATLARLAANGAQMLQIPASYYDDAAARWGLDDETQAALRAANLLYDRDDGGELLHAYTQTFADRFFFEVVERRGAMGFGAANAAVRMAAQAQQRSSRRTTTAL